MQSVPQFRQAGHVLKVLEENRLSAEELFELTNGLSDLAQAIKGQTLPDRDVVRAFYGLPSLQTESKTYSLSINTRRSSAKMMSSVHYDRSRMDDREVLDRFPVKNSGIVRCEVKLFCFGFMLTGDMAGKRITGSGWKLARAEHFFAFGAKHLHLHRNCGIFALGSTCKATNSIMGQRMDKEGRELFLYQQAGPFSPEAKFLGFRIIAPTIKKKK